MAEKKEYPVEFVKRVKDEFPNNSNIHRLLDEGSQMVGRYLDDCSSDINPDKVVKMIDQGRIQELRREAAQLLRLKKLYTEWYDIAQKMFYERSRP